MTIASTIQKPFTICDAYEGLPAHTMFTQMKNYRVTAILDARLHVPDDPSLYIGRTNLLFFTEQFGCRYAREEALLPSFQAIADVRTALEKATATSQEIRRNFFRSYAAELQNKREALTAPHSVLATLLQKHPDGVLVLGHEVEALHDHRCVLTRFLKSVVPGSRIVTVSEDAAIHGTQPSPPMSPEDSPSFTELVPRGDPLVQPKAGIPQGRSWRETLPGMRLENGRVFVKVGTEHPPLVINACRTIFSEETGMVMLTDNMGLSVRCTWDDPDIQNLIRLEAIEYSQVYDRPVTVEFKMIPVPNQPGWENPRVIKFHLP